VTGLARRASRTPGCLPEPDPAAVQVDGIRRRGVPGSATGRVCPDLSAPSGTVGGMENLSDLLMLRGVSATCTQCAGEAIFVPVEDGFAGEFCCTSCDAAVFLSLVPAAAASEPSGPATLSA